MTTQAHLTDEEIATFFARRTSPVMNLKARLVLEGLKDEDCAKWEQLDLLCEKQLDWIRVRFQMLKSFSSLWVSAPRSSSTAWSTSELQESGYHEIQARSLIFRLFDDLIVGTPMNCLLIISECASQLLDEWTRFRCPLGVRAALLGRIWRLKKNSK